jgi:type II secretory pathway pseudopilin PulG
MNANRLTSTAGFTLIAAMVAVTIIGIMLGATGQSWTMFMKREREEELLFRGMQYRNAITRWYNGGKIPSAVPGTPLGTGVTTPPLQTFKKPLKDLKFLLQDPNSPGAVRYLRRLYNDPITGKDFVPVLDANQNIIGVRSASEDQPMKVGNFPEELKVFLADKKKYSEWQFVCGTQPAAAAGNINLNNPFGVPVPQ